MNQTCKWCGESKPLTEFGFRQDRGCYKKHCKTCYNQKHGPRATERATAWNKRNAIARRNSTLKTYGIDVETYEELSEAQRGCCAICGVPESEACLGRSTTKKLFVDHNHITGEVRGLLCHKCNMGIGYLQGDTGTAILDAAVVYLQRGNR